ncbi:MAG: sugar phosphate isomerase/epimerase [Armatimonadetes bacterium]|nr:sugar phosphate isomerase/epimerase [Armatimonadota bacterium]
MLLGGPIFEETSDPDQWAHAVLAAAYQAAYCPVGPSAPDDLVKEYEAAAQRAGIVIAEVGAWSNPLAHDESERKAALDKCKSCLYLADRIGARCCVNVAGSLGPRWDGPDPRDLTDEAFDAIVLSVREIIDAVQPTRTFYTLETMPWMYPDSADSYLRLIAAIDRPAFGVHFDPVNLICSPQRYYDNGALIADFVHKLGPRIKSCHAKDVIMSTDFICHISETRPGLGNLDYRAFLREISRLSEPVPIMLEHLATAEEYAAAAAYIRSVAAEIGVG